MLRLHVNKTCFSPRNTGVRKFFYGIQSRLRSLYYLCSSYPSAPGAKYVSTRVPPVRLYPSAPSTSLPECPQCVSTRVVSTRVPPVCLYPSAPGAKYVSTRVPPVRLYPSTPSVLALCFCGIQNVTTEYFTRRRLHIIASKEALKGLESV